MRFMLLFVIAMILTISWQTAVFADLFAKPDVTCADPAHYPYTGRYWNRFADNPRQGC